MTNNDVDSIVVYYQPFNTFISKFTKTLSVLNVLVVVVLGWTFDLGISVIVRPESRSRSLPCLQFIKYTNCTIKLILTNKYLIGKAFGKLFHRHVLERDDALPVLQFGFIICDTSVRLGDECVDSCLLDFDNTRNIRNRQTDVILYIKIINHKKY